MPAHHGEGGGQAGEEVDAQGQGPQSAEDVQAEGHCQHRLLGRTTNHVHAGIRMRLLNCSQIFFLLLLKLLHILAQILFSKYENHLKHFFVDLLPYIDKNKGFLLKCILFIFIDYPLNTCSPLGKIRKIVLIKP